MRPSIETRIYSREVQTTTMVCYATAHFKLRSPSRSLSSSFLPTSTTFCSFLSNWKPLNTFHLKIIQMPHFAKRSNQHLDPRRLSLFNSVHSLTGNMNQSVFLTTKIINPTKAFFQSTKSTSLSLPFLFYMFTSHPAYQRFR